ncbi:MAG: cytochrome c oxidase subunit 2A [Chloroflexi bacterium]|nr:cytochrome c oxidase subunit 2A [Chloroflexota bacterium]
MKKDAKPGQGSAKKGDPEMEHPKGALAISLIYLITIVILWSWVYLTLLERGVTQ